jgi:hypothetical protein
VAEDPRCQPVGGRVREGQRLVEGVHLADDDEGHEELVAEEPVAGGQAAHHGWLREVAALRLAVAQHVAADLDPAPIGLCLRHR